MNILFTSLYAGPRGGGIPPVMQALLGEWTNGGPQVRIVTLDRDTAEEIEKLNPNTPVEIVPEHRPRLGFGRGWQAALRQARPELVHAHGLWCGISLQTAHTCRADGIPWIVSPHGMLSPGALGISRWKKRISFPFLESLNLRGAAALHALNQDELRNIRDFGLKRPVAIIPNGVALPADVDWMSSKSTAKQFHTLLFLGRIHRKKGLSTFLNAWKQLKPESWKLRIVGVDDGGHRQELEERVAEIGLGESVHFHGPVYGEAKHQCFLEADAFVLPSLSEGQPMAVLEAWSYGLPVLMTRECNLPEGFEAGAAVELSIEAGAQAEALKAFFGLSDAERQSIGQKGRALVEKHFSWESSAGKYEALYCWILNQGPKPGFVVEE